MRLPALFREGRLPMMRKWFGEDFERMFDRMFEDFGRTRLPAWPAEAEMAFVPDIDLTESEKEYILKAELPGVALEDVEVSVVGDNIQIKGEKKEEKEEKDKNYYFSEMTYGSFVRTIPLPTAVKAEGIQAKLEKGILIVTLPKSEVAQAKKVEVKGETPAKAEAKETPKGDAPRPRDVKEREWR